MRRSVAITGLGPLCSISDSPESFAHALTAGERSITPIRTFDASGHASRLAGQVAEYKIRDWVPKSYRKATKVMARDTELAVIAAALAAKDAGLATRAAEDDEQGFAIDPARTGCHIGAGLIAADAAEMSRAVVHAKDDAGAFDPRCWGTEPPGAGGMNNLPPLWLLKYLPNMLACHVTIIHGLEGPSNTIMGAEASALLSIGESARLIERDDADLCLAGGAEARVNPHGLLRWELTGRLAHADESDDPRALCAPYDPASSGAFLGDAGAMLVLEDLDHARARGAEPYAVVSGFAAAQSLSPMLPGRDDEQHTIDDGLEAAITGALRDAGCGAKDIDAVFPLAQGVPALDARERAAIESALGDRVRAVPWFGLADRTGNTLAAHAGLAAAAAAVTLRAGACPSEPITVAGSGSAPGVAPRRVLVCTGSIAGQCAALVLSAVDPNDP